MLRLCTQPLRAGPESRDSKLHEYSRQYAGIYRAGRRLVRVNAIHGAFFEHDIESLVAEGADRAEAVGRTEDGIRGRAIHVCDGGRGFFQAEYDVVADSITTFTFGGIA